MSVNQDHAREHGQATAEQTRCRPAVHDLSCAPQTENADAARNKQRDAQQMLWQAMCQQKRGDIGVEQVMRKEEHGIHADHDAENACSLRGADSRNFERLGVRPTNGGR